jgi:hypothetical protein
VTNLRKLVVMLPFIGPPLGHHPRDASPAAILAEAPAASATSPSAGQAGSYRAPRSNSPEPNAVTTPSTAGSPAPRLHFWRPGQIGSEAQQPDPELGAMERMRSALASGNVDAAIEAIEEHERFAGPASAARREEAWRKLCARYPASPRLEKHCAAR